MSTAADDDLGSFFSEIEQIEQSAPGDHAEDLEQKEEIKIAPPVEIVSKPQLISRNSDKALPMIHGAYGGAYSSSLAGAKESDEVSAFERGSLYPVEIPFVESHHQPVSQPFIPIQKNKKYIRAGGGNSWVDPTLNEWPENDFRIFVGDLGNEVTTDTLAREFQCYPSFAKAKVIREGWDNKTKGYGFVSFLDPFDCAKAIREKNGKYLGYRPMKIRKSSWNELNINEVKKKEKRKRKLNESLGLT